MKLHLQKILKELQPYRERKGPIDPKHAVLLVIDLQNYFQQMIHPVLKNISAVIQACRQKNIPVVFTQHGHTDSPSDRGTLGQWWGEVILRGTKDWEFLPGLKIDPKDIILPKNRYSAFYKTQLESFLQSKGTRELIISGVMTNLCCETTARDAFMRDFRVFFLIDGTATGKEEYHLATLKNLGYGFAYLMTCEELIHYLEAG